MIKSIAIGAFDGIHVAHNVLVDKADAIIVIERNGAVLTPGHKRAKYTNKPIFFYHLDKIKDLTPKEFIDLLMKNFKDLEEIIVGYDFGFGRDKSGSIDTLKEFFVGNVTVIEMIKYEDIAIHSRVIKNYIREGKIQEANKMLGRSYQISGSVITGQGLGSKRFVPTLNIDITGYLLPKEGIYATQTKIGDIWHKSVSFIGHRVSTDGKFAVETHIVDKEIHGVKNLVEIKFEQFIRGNKKFDNLDELKEQIDKDIQKVKEFI
ncbi:MAG: bifunctional riboflavin kinase/FAD synthetase [Sulfurovaceae bacterium]|nr:bifunctional riboflavin kinase/FAD synthetase [Sulfurovaceae bacterium]MDD5549099.1 bifunctional riboflavin kinase/FAD synthetase [Sulfurovaceae bacterium]